MTAKCSWNCDRGMQYNSEASLMIYDEDSYKDLGHLIDRTLNRRKLDGIASGEQVHTNDGDAIRELFDVLPRTRQSVKVIQIRKGTEKGSGCQLSVANDQTMFPRPLKLKHLNDWA